MKRVGQTAPPVSVPKKKIPRPVHYQRGKTPEGLLKAACINYLKFHGWMVTINFNGYLGAIPGRPDLQALRKGLTIYIETKTKDGRMSPAQKEYCHKLHVHGGIVFIPRSSDEFRDDLDALQDRMWPGECSKRLA